MCGICGFVTKNEVNIDCLRKMNQTMIHRGPDDHGEELYSIGCDWTVGFGHRRLSIMDLSEKGHQPMHSYDKRISVVYNGEIYNFDALKQELSDYPFVTRCDTEVILAAYLKWGIEFVKRLNGMFAIALLDRENDALFLWRDRIGKKPLFYYSDYESNFVFASELKALISYPGIQREVNEEVVGRYLNKRYTTAPDTMYKNIYKLEAGTMLSFRAGIISKKKYWDVAEKYNELKKRPIMDYEQAKMELKKELSDAVASRLIADVPVGAFISGGYDSSLMCAVAQRQMDMPLKTFCIGFENAECNEAPYARQVAEYIGTEHEELYMTNKDAFDMVDSIPEYYDEPSADPSLFPTMFVSQLAKKKVSVVLSGDGGDELFGGYNIYTYLQQAQKIRESGGDISALKQGSIVYRILTEDVRKENKTQAGVLNYITHINQMLLQPTDNFYFEYESKYQEKRYDVTRMLLDTETNLVDYMLVKIDRASMRYSLECRCPFLDKNIVEYSYRLPPEFKDDNGNQKRILKDIAYEYIPQELLDRPKQGFAPPIDQWLRGPLKSQLLDYVDSSFLRNQNIFHVSRTQRIIKEYLDNGDAGAWSGKNLSKIIWPYFILQQWYCRYML